MKIKAVNASRSKPNGKPTPGYKLTGIEKDILFYQIEDGDNTEEG